MSGRFLDEPKLLGLAYDLERELGKRDIPKFLGAVPGPFADAGICAALPATGDAARTMQGELRASTPADRRMRPAM
jgi:hypothetical protein